MSDLREALELRADRLAGSSQPRPFAEITARHRARNRVRRAAGVAVAAALAAGAVFAVSLVREPSSGVRERSVVSGEHSPPTSSTAETTAIVTFAQLEGFDPSTDGRLLDRCTSLPGAGVVQQRTSTGSVHFTGSGEQLAALRSCLASVPHLRTGELVRGTPDDLCGLAPVVLAKLHAQEVGELVGLPLPEAQARAAKLGAQVHVVGTDGQCGQWQQGAINLYVEHGRVRAAAK